METTIESIWSRSKLLVKTLIIAVLVLLLLIPTFSVQNLVAEREARQKEAIAEVSSKWAGPQNVTGPILVLPYWVNEGDSSLKKHSKHYASFLPDELQVTAKLIPQEKSRGIYKVMLYNSKINISGIFRTVQPQKLNIPVENIIWNESFIRLHLSDYKGLNDEPKLTWNDQPLNLTAQSVDPVAMEEGLIAPLSLTGINDLKDIHFSSELNLSGSEKLLFTPVGKSTSVQLLSSWPHPSFTGNIL